MVKRISKRHRFFKILLITVVVLAAIRLALPYVILKYANNSLANVPGYRGHVEDIDLAIIRGAYTIDSIYLNKVDTVTRKETPFFAASMIDLSVEWKALLNGEIVGEMIFTRPMLRFTKDKVEPEEVRKDSSDLKQLLDDFMPLRVNRFEAKGGSIQFIDENSKPKVDIEMTDTYILATNLRNSYDSGVLLPATILAKGSVYGGTLDLNVKLNPLADDPTFDMDAEMKNTNLVRLNDFFKAYAKVDVNKGTFGLYTELAAKGGKFKGYVKPLIKDLDVLGKEDRNDNILRKTWEGIVGTVGEVLENQPKERLATKIPLEGSTKNLDTNVWYAIGEVLQNAFIRAIQPSLDQDINIQIVDAEKSRKKNFLEKVFGKKGEKKEANKKKG